VLRQQGILTLAFFEVLSGVDEQYVVVFLAFFQDEDADRDAGRKKVVGGEADDGEFRPGCFLTVAA
jgi:hypothetical protein